MFIARPGKVDMHSGRLEGKVSAGRRAWGEVLDSCRWWPRPKIRVGIYASFGQDEPFF